MGGSPPALPQAPSDSASLPLTMQPPRLPARVNELHESYFALRFIHRRRYRRFSPGRPRTAELPSQSMPPNPSTPLSDSHAGIPRSAHRPSARAGPRIGRLASHKVEGAGIHHRSAEAPLSHGADDVGRYRGMAVVDVKEGGRAKADDRGQLHTRSLSLGFAQVRAYRHAQDGAGKYEVVDSIFPLNLVYVYPLSPSPPLSYATPAHPTLRSSFLPSLDT
ncbi:hypothetical protein R3P38DRAFT_3225557 [Favolaschia claudopus]|uniref:Uncharacterized protein n=1 Tax=Favolaschia claudopus TaxID=2862362 RepID=A0AAV9ZUA2_9AGAR